MEKNIEIMNLLIEFQNKSMAFFYNKDNINNSNYIIKEIIDNNVVLLDNNNNSKLENIDSINELYEKNKIYFFDQYIIDSFDQEKEYAIFFDDKKRFIPLWQFIKFKEMILVDKLSVINFLTTPWSLVSIYWQENYFYMDKIDYDTMDK